MSQESLLPRMDRTLILHGHTPSKKNLWKRGKGGRTYIDDEVKAMLDALTTQAKAMWPDPPLKNPEMEITFYVRDQRPDRDNKLTALLDCLREAGVIKNDNIKSCNGTITMRPAVIDARERVVVRITAP